MNQKTVSQLDAAGYFVGETIAHESPLEPGKFLIPGGAIDRKPPQAIEPGKRYRPEGKEWQAEDIPQPPAPEPEPQPEPTPAPTPEELRREGITKRLAQIDLESIRPARAVAAALAEGRPVSAFDAAKLDNLETEAAALRAELASLK